MPFSGLTGVCVRRNFRAHWRRARGGIEALDGEKEKKKESILAGISKGLGIIVLTPVVLSGAVLFGAGAIAYGTGKFLVGLGHVATCGKLR